MESNETMVDDWQGKKDNRIPVVKNSRPIKRPWIDIRYHKVTLIEVKGIPLKDRIKCLLSGNLFVNSMESVTESYMIRQSIEGKETKRYRK